MWQVRGRRCMVVPGRSWKGRQAGGRHGSGVVAGQVGVVVQAGRLCRRARSGRWWVEGGVVVV